ncbi:MAG: DUF2071 domain-containing protein [Gaiellaceae bacterium]
MPECVRVRASRDRPGISFFRLDASSRSAVEAARRTYRLPYRHASIDARGSTFVAFAATASARSTAAPRSRQRVHRPAPPKPIGSPAEAVPVDSRTPGHTRCRLGAGPS